MGQLVWPLLVHVAKLIQSAGQRKEKKTVERVEAGFEDLVKWHLKLRCTVPNNKTTQRVGHAYFKLKKRKNGA
jgi:hypothetical protein